MANGVIDRWLGRASNAVTFWAVVPSGFVGLVSGYLASGVGWISQYGAWGWFSAGLLSFFVSSLSFAAIARTKLWRIDAKQRARLAGDSSPFDPMATTYESKRLYLRDLAPAGRRFVAGRTFINCEIIGPGTIIVGTKSHENKPWPAMSETLMVDSDVVQIAPTALSQLAIGFPDCNFHGCKFFNLTLLFFWRGENTNGWNWITSENPQPTQIEAQPSAQS